MPNGIRVIGAAMSVPRTLQTTSELAPKLGKSTDWLIQQTGVHQRWTSEVGDDPTRLAADAAQKVLEQHACVPDLVIHCCSVDRQAIPDGSVYVLKHLGLSGIPSFCVRATCLSFIVGLQNAAAAMERGDAIRVLITASDFASQSRNFSDPHTASLLGDGAAAILIERSQDRSTIQWKMRTWPEHSQLSEIRGGGLLNPPFAASTPPEHHLFSMDGPALLRVALPNLKQFLPEFLEKAGVTLKEVDWVVPHQASQQGFRLLHALGALETKTINILAHYGNCAAASIPMAFAAGWNDHRIQSGHTVLFLGTAAGFSIGAALIQC